MEALEKLENSIDGLIGRLEALKSEVARLTEELANREQERNALAEENQSLRDTIRKEEDLRVEAVARIDALLRKVQDYVG